MSKFAYMMSTSFIKRLKFLSEFLIGQPSLITENERSFSNAIVNLSSYVMLVDGVVQTQELNEMRQLFLGVFAEDINEIHKSLLNTLEKYRQMTIEEIEKENEDLCSRLVITLSLYKRRMIVDFLLRLITSDGVVTHEEKVAIQNIAQWLDIHIQ